MSGNYNESFHFSAEHECGDCQSWADVKWRSLKGSQVCFIVLYRSRAHRRGGLLLPSYLGLT